MTGGMARGRGPVEFLALIQVLMFFPLANCGGTGSEAALDLGDAARITIKTAELSTGEVGVSYQATLEASGGTGPYNWRISAGVLPPGLSFDSKSGTISGTPVDAGDFSFTVQVSDSGKPSAAKGSRDLMIAIVPRLQIATTTLYSSYVGHPYEARLTSFGGIPPFRWDVPSGALPPGLRLESHEGEIKGTPTAGGRYAVVVRVRDSIQPVPATATKTLELILSDIRLDRYGGLADAPVSGGATGFFRVAKVGNRWTLVTPEGNAYFMIGVYNVGANKRVDELGDSMLNRVHNKYGIDAYVYPQFNRRMKSWGFNAIGPYSYRMALPTDYEKEWPGGQHPEKRPFVGIASKPGAGCRADGSCKNLYKGLDPATFMDGGTFPDVYDPKYEAFVQASYVADSNLASYRTSPYFIGYFGDDTDFLHGFGSGVDFPTDPPRKYHWHLGFLALVTSPFQRSNPYSDPPNQPYSEIEVHTKHALHDWLLEKYGTIAALNAAWGSRYTTFESDGGWPSGEGLMDENGRSSHSWLGSRPDPYFLTGMNYQVKADLDDFLYALSAKYFAVNRSAFKAVAPNNLFLGPSCLGGQGWRSPTRGPTLKAGGEYSDFVSVSTDCSQAQLDFIAQWTGDVPLAIWQGIVANADSGRWRAPGETSSWNVATQALRGQRYQADMRNLLEGTVTSTRSRPYVGLLFWAWHDDIAEGMNWGLVSLLDNAYDGLEGSRTSRTPGTVASGKCKDSWGFPCGTEERNYGDFLTPVREANLYVMRTILTELAH